MSFVLQHSSDSIRIECVKERRIDSILMCAHPCVCSHCPRSPIDAHSVGNAQRHRPHSSIPTFRHVASNANYTKYTYRFRFLFPFPCDLFIHCRSCTFNVCPSCLHADGGTADGLFIFIYNFCFFCFVSNSLHKANGAQCTRDACNACIRFCAMFMSRQRRRRFELLLNIHVGIDWIVSISHANRFHSLF